MMGTGESLMMDILTYWVSTVSVIVLVLLTVVVVKIYNVDHPLNQDRQDV